MKRKVHIKSWDGRIIYNRLWDDGSKVFRFESGNGFVDLTFSPTTKICDGWPNFSPWSADVPQAFYPHHDEARIHDPSI